MLEKYLKTWFPILASANGRLLYIDGFAGRGEYNDGSFGSPIVAMKAYQEISHMIKKPVEIVFVFVEENPDNCSNLTAVVEKQRENFPSITNIEIVNSDFDSYINRILDEHANLAPAFFFIDPFGYSDIPMSTIKRILSRPKTEVFINLMAREMNRFVGVPHQDKNFDALFGTNIWRDAIEYKGERRDAFLRDLYLSSLLASGAAKHAIPFKICEDRKCSTLYHLIYATNYFKGIHIMKGIMYNQSDVFSFLGPKERDSQFRQAQMTLFDDGKEELMKYLLATYSPGVIRTYNQIIEETYANTRVIDKHYRAAIYELEGEGKVTIRRISSKRNGLSENDSITFL